MSEEKIVSYEQFGALGDGVTNDFPAIYAAHNYANENGLTVKAEAGKTYYISDTRIDGSVKSIIIKTNVTWTGAEFIIDDSLYSTHENYGMYGSHVFKIASDFTDEKISDEATLERVLSAGLNKQTKKIELNLGYPALLIPYNSSHKVYRRREYAQWAGMSMHEIILVDKDGNVDPETPLMWDYNALDYIDVIRTDVTPITVEGGKITTIACNTNCVVYDENGKPIRVNEPYIMRGLAIARSYTTVRGVEHCVRGEISLLRQKKGEVGAPYSGFFSASRATNIVIESCIMTGKRCYDKRWAGPFGGTMGTYDFSSGYVNKIVLKNCTQSNFWVTLDENGEFHPAKEGDEGAVLSLSQMPNDEGISARIHWGIGGTNYCKNMEYIGCTLTRYDAHQGLYNGKIIDSTLVSFALTGCGDMTVKNLRIYSEAHSSNNMFGMRSDYGSIWNGSVDIDGLKMYAYTKKSTRPNAPTGEYKPIGVVGHHYCNWYYGYDCKFPNVSLNNIEIYDIETGEPLPEGYEVTLIAGKSG